MSNPLKDRPIAQGIVGNVLSAPIVYYGGALMVAIIAAVSSYLNDVPLYRAINLGVFVFLGLAIAIFLISLAVNNFRAQRPARIEAETAPKELGSEGAEPLVPASAWDILRRSEGTDLTPRLPTPSLFGFESWVERARAHAAEQAKKPNIEGHIHKPTATRNALVRPGETISFVTMRVVFTNKGADTTISNFGIEIRLRDSVRTESRLYRGQIYREVTGEKTGKHFRNLAECLDHDKVLGRNQHRDGYLQFIVDGLTVRQLEDRDVILPVYDGTLTPHRLSGDRIQAGTGEGGLEVGEGEYEHKLRIAGELNELLQEGLDILRKYSQKVEHPSIAWWKALLRTKIEETFGKVEADELFRETGMKAYPHPAIDRPYVNRLYTLTERLGELITQLRRR